MGYRKRLSRMPRIGDVIVETELLSRWETAAPSDVGKKWIGVVYDIILDDYGHQRNVFIEWSTHSKPHNYNIKHGYGGTNIHNLRDRFRVVRDGVDIL